MMLDYSQKRKVRFVMYHRITLALLSILVLIFIHSTWIVYKKKTESEEMKNISQKNVDKLKSRSNELESRINKLATVSGIEEEIRSKFSVAKGGENVVVVVAGDEAKLSTTSQSRGFWDIIKDLFNNK